MNQSTTTADPLLLTSEQRYQLRYVVYFWIQGVAYSIICSIGMWYQYKLKSIPQCIILAFPSSINWHVKNIPTMHLIFQEYSVKIVCYYHSLCVSGISKIMHYGIIIIILFWWHHMLFSFLKVWSICTVEILKMWQSGWQWLWLNWMACLHPACTYQSLPANQLLKSFHAKGFAHRVCLWDCYTFQLLRIDNLFIILFMFVVQAFWLIFWTLSHYGDRENW